MILDILRNPELFSYTPMSLLAGIFVGLFFLLVIVYSTRFMKGREGLFRYYAYLFLTLVCSLVVVFANNIMLLFTFWGLLGLLLYLLIGFGQGERAPAAARKALIIVGGTDVLMMLGIVLAWVMGRGAGSGIAGLFGMTFSNTTIPITGGLSVTAFVCLASGALAKAGAMPFHTWVPDTAEDAPVPVTAFLPASLDKILGVFFLARVSLELFSLTQAVNTAMMALGSFTILAAVMMALVQHDLKRLLGYHAVSQVGYMVLGIGTGTPIGIAGALFHMFNNAIYKSSLFFAGGVVERRAGTSNLARLGGLVRTMPMVFLAFLVASLSISGVPPFNGFASKWMLYQGVIATGGSGWLWVVWLVAAMLGSALTLASFMKLVHAVFLGQPSPPSEQQGGIMEKTGFAFGFPLAVLSVLCAVLGIIAWKLPFASLFRPMTAPLGPVAGVWHSGLVTAMILAGFVVGILFYLAGTARRTREVDAFVGGQDLDCHPSMRVSGVDFYATVKDLPVIRTVYSWAERKFFDIYNLGLRLLGSVGGVLSSLHDGLLPRYLAWCLVGLVALYIVLIG